MQKPQALRYDGPVTIAVGWSRTSREWRNQEMLWSELVRKLTETTRTPETAEEYARMTRAQQGQVKDVGGFVGGTLTGGRRRADAVAWRSLLTLDIDEATEDPWDAVDLMLGCAAVLYTTHSSTAEKPRYRLVAPLARPVTPDEYAALSRRLAADVGMDMVDDSTYEPSRLMYWPSTSTDGHWRCEVMDGPWLDPDAQLQRYADWRDPTQWPRSSRQDRIVQRLADKQANPLEKEGWVGAFCRAYPVPEAIETFLDGVYTPAGEGRYTYAAGSTVGGLVLYDGGAFAYSHHGTDPAGGQLVNAFDLVRIHRFGRLDAGAPEGTPASRLPSFLAMQDLARGDERVRLESARRAFGGEQREADDWLMQLEQDRRGRILATAPNVEIILEHDSCLAGGLTYNEFRERPAGGAQLPWRTQDGDWTDADDAALRSYLEGRYGISSVGKVMDAVSNVMMRHRWHPVREYLEGLNWDGERRADALLIDWLGAQDTPYTRAVTRKALVGAVKRIFEPGCKHDHMLVLVGAQGTGKSTLLARLGGAWFSDSLVSVTGKDAYEQLQGVWILEMAELAATRKADAESIKQFISKQVDNYRAAYGRRTQEHARQCAFFGTTNEQEFIRDNTGGRRFWVVEIDAQPRRHERLWEELTKEMRDQIWAEAVRCYRAGEPLFLPPELEAEARSIQETHMEGNVKQGLIERFLDTRLPENWAQMGIEERRDYLHGDGLGVMPEGVRLRDRVCLAEILCECLGLDLKRVEPKERREVADLMKRIKGWKPLNTSARFGEYGTQKGYQRCQP